MILLTETHDGIAERCDTLAIEVEDRSTQDLRQIKHCLNSRWAISRMIARVFSRGISVAQVFGQSLDEKYWTAMDTCKRMSRP